MNETARKVMDTFSNQFKAEPRLFYSPGRINLIGEHIDYNDGFVMPAAIDKGIYFAISLNSTGFINCYSLDFDQHILIPLAEVKKSEGWKNYVLGVVNEFQQQQLPVSGFDCVFGGDIPIGSGMSSSAALEGGISFGLNELCGFGESPKELALLGQRAEHGFPGVMCGIMDQYANMMGKKNKVILLDCKKITHEYIPLNLDGYTIVLINSKVHHSLAGSEYNQRRIECGRGLGILRRKLGIQSFRGITDPAELNAFKEEMGSKVFSRCLFVVEEILRTKKAADLLQANDLNGFGALMYQSHEGLRDLYQVSCKELDFLAGTAKNNGNVIGSRLMGGGFGGCTINIVKQEAIHSFLSEILPAYKKEFGIEAESYEVNTVDGTHEIND